jgi:four helix bundle protein
MDGRIRSYRDLVVYQIACELKVRVYRATVGFPAPERYGLVSQMRRAAVSVTANIAEGYRRKTRNEYVQFLMFAHGSCSELDDHFALSKDVGFMPKEVYRELHTLDVKVSRLLTNLISALKNPRQCIPPNPYPQYVTLTNRANTSP